MAQIFSKDWFKGLAVAALSGFSHGIAAVVFDPKDFNLHAGLHLLLGFSLACAVKDTILYLVNSKSS